MRTQALLTWLTWSTFLLCGGCTAPQTLSPVSGMGPEPFAKPAPAPPNPALAAYQERVTTTGYKLVAANGEAMQQLRPNWTVIEGNNPGVLYEGEQAYLTDGLVRACATEGQLAAVMSWTMGQMYHARQARLAANAAALSVRPPETFRVGHDGSGFTEADPAFQAQYRREMELQKERRLAKMPAPEPLIIARQVVAQAGYSIHELDQVKDLLHQLDTQEK